MLPVRKTSSLAWFAALLLGVSPGQSQSASSLGLVDLAGKAANPLAQPASRWLTFIFVRTDCPVANVYAPEIQRLAAHYASRGVTFHLVYCDADETPEVIRQHNSDYGYTLPAFRDPEQHFARHSKVKITPEAAVYQADGKLLYHGRIDDRYEDLGRARPEPTHRDLAQALDAAVAGRAIPKAAGPAVGCFIEGL